MNSPKILVVDDTFANRFLILEILNKGDYVISEAQNGKEAMSKLTSFSPDVVLLDIEMPVMNGYEVIKKIRELPYPQKNTVVIAVTAHLKENLIIKKSCNSFNAVISKPFTAEKLNNTIQMSLKNDF